MYRACHRFGDFQNWIYCACHTFGECRSQIGRARARFGERPIWDFKILNAEVAGRRLCWGGEVTMCGPTLYWVPVRLMGQWRSRVCFFSLANTAETIVTALRPQTGRVPEV